MRRTIIKIDDALCNGCGACVSGCHEGALQLIDGKAVMVSELYCDGLGACIGECPVGAITLEEREAEPYDEAAVMERIAPKGEAVVKAHLNHLREHGEQELLMQGLKWLDEHNMKINMETKEEKPMACGCPGSMARNFTPMSQVGTAGVSGAMTGFAAGGAGMSFAGGQPSGVQAGATVDQPSELRQFPVQLHLLNPMAPFLQGADLLLAADCTAFAAGNFHSRFLKGKILAIACPKLDSNTQSYIDKLSAMIDTSKINTLTVVVMEVPCCGGLVRIAQAAREQASRNVPVKVIVLSVQGEIISEEWI